MMCKQFREYMADVFTGNLDSEMRIDFEAHLKACDTCSREFEQMKAAWEAMGMLEDQEPSAGLRSRFYTMLESEKREMRKANRRDFERWVASWWPRRPVVQAAFSMGLLILGLFIGNRLQLTGRRNGEMAQLREEIRDMRQTVSLSLVSQPKSSDRLSGVNFSTRIDSPNESLIQALLRTLNQDPNVNVRLAAVDALLVFSDRPGVRDALIASIPEQTSPLVQISLIDLLIQIQEKRSLEALRLLIERQEVDPAVRQHAEKRMQELT